MSGEVCMFVHHKVRQSTLFWGNLVILAGLSSWGTAQNLEDCIREAFWRNPAYQAARRRVDVAHFEWAETHSAYLPELTLKSSYVRTDRPSEVFLAQLNRDDMHPWCGDGRELSDIEKMGNLRVSVEAGLCLYDGGLRGALRRRTHLGVRLATECARNILNDVVLRVTCEYYNVLRLRSLLDDYTSDLLTLEEVMDLARQPLREPVTSDSVTGELDAILAMKRERISRTRRELSLAVAALNAAIGGTVVTDHKAVPLLSPNLPSAPPAEPDSAVLLDHAEYRIVQIHARMCEESYRHT
ncbi:MAG: TolC family protein, partial [Kiritimatiellae bacterium]|nr:TolC family protein [Kiritimatiellia bacterium]